MDALKQYEIYGERNVEPDANAEENAKRTIEKLKLLKNFNEERKARTIRGTTINIDTIYYSTNVPYRSQETSYWCGPATGLQTIANWGRESKGFNHYVYI
ncbi:MAG: hypothetical protein QHH10_04790 [Peptococcaceae bacterium]|jgi:hypothetical protein|nr:hypothetical protein [Peptococcaceae bacterium]MDH7524615.1 hypothetical protein [Peptococcaceae bacterium]